MTQETTSPVGKRQKRKARRVLSAFHKRLVKACGSFNTADEWAEFCQPLRDVLPQLESALPAGAAGRLASATGLANPSRDAINNACQALQRDLSGVIEQLPGGGILAPLVAGSVAGVAAAVIGGAIYLNASAIAIDVANQGCAPIMLASFPLPFPGLSIPDAPVAAGAHALITVPRVGVDVEAEADGTLVLHALKASLPIEVANVVAITLNGESLLGGTTAVELGNREQHELVIRCAL